MIKQAYYHAVLKELAAFNPGITVDDLLTLFYSVSPNDPRTTNIRAAAVAVVKEQSELSSADRTDRAA